jgi:hypothetical protein
MLRARRRITFRPPLVPSLVMGTAALISLAAAQLASAAPLGSPVVSADCAAAGARAQAAARHIGLPAAISDRIDTSGVFLGRSISLDLPGRAIAITLPAESSVSPATGDALVYTRAIGGISEVHLVDLATGCDALLARPAGTARSAVLDPAATAVYVHGVTFPARSDAGVTRYALDGGAARLVVPPLPDDPRFGVTFGTQLGWSTDGTTLFVQSCGAQECRTRLLDTSGSVQTVDSRGHGQIIGVTRAHLVTYAACPGLPCAAISRDLATGVETTLADEAWSASLNGTTLDIDTAGGNVEVAQ